MKTLNLCLTLGLAALVGPLQARDWGFSRDTVNEWEGANYDSAHYGVRDTLGIWNTGADTIWLDTAWLEVIQPTEPEKYFQYVGYDFGSSNGFQGALWGQFDRPELFPWPQIWVDKSRTKKMSGVRVDGLLKNELIAPKSTLIVARAIYKARNRGEDTLIVVGDFTNPCCITNIVKPKMRVSDKLKSKQDTHVNVQGRHENKLDKRVDSPIQFSIPTQKKGGN